MNEKATELVAHFEAVLAGDQIPDRPGTVALQDSLFTWKQDHWVVSHLPCVCFRVDRLAVVRLPKNEWMGWSLEKMPGQRVFVVARDDLRQLRRFFDELEVIWEQP